MVHYLIKKKTIAVAPTVGKSHESLSVFVQNCLI